MAKGKLTKRTVNSLVCPPGKGRVALFDAELAGFHVEALVSGRKVYRYSAGGSRGGDFGEAR